MSVPVLIRDFYERIWHAGDRSALSELLTEDFTFRGSLGVEQRGRDALWKYVTDIRTALRGYRCEILESVTEGDAAFLKMRFSGIHVGTFRGFAPTNKTVHWHGAALFHLRDGKIGDLWALGDLVGLDSLLRTNASL